MRRNSRKGTPAGPAVMSARAPPSTPLEAVKRGVDDFGAALQRFDRRVKEALRKIPGSKVPGAVQFGIARNSGGSSPLRSRLVSDDVFRW